MSFPIGGAEDSFDVNRKRSHDIQSDPEAWAAAFEAATLGAEEDVEMVDFGAHVPDIQAAQAFARPHFAESATRIASIGREVKQMSSTDPRLAGKMLDLVNAVLT